MLPDIFTSGDLLAFGDDTGSDLIREYFCVIKEILSLLPCCLEASDVFHVYLCVEFARSRASLCGSGLFTDTNGECDGGGEKGG